MFKSTPRPLSSSKVLQHSKSQTLDFAADSAPWWVTMSILPSGVVVAWPIMGKHDVIYNTGNA